MAVKTKAKKGGGAKKKPAAAKKRASNDELDAQAATIVDLRDNQDKSWSEVAEETGIAMGRLRGLYNRGGGEPTRERKGKAKKAAVEAGKKLAKKGKAARGKKKAATPS